ncbi:MAG: HAD-IA family hydrolase [Pseudobutyrivibrio sp.]|nr:HAD-IA family hydrolase [Pseudobutyrivibrio sp.]
MKYNTILFDLDGTLLYTLEDLADSVNYMLKKYNLPTRSNGEIRRFLGNGLKNLVIDSLPDGENYEHFDKFLEEFIDYYNHHNRIKTKPYDGVLETTKTLADMGLNLAIVTNKGQTAANSLMDDYFRPAVSLIIGDDGTHKRKPDPEPIDLALLKLGVTDKSKVLYVGDSDVDAATAENSDLDYVLCTYGFRDMDDLKDFKPVAFIDNIKDLINCI